MIYPKIPLAQSIVEICLLKGITTVVISPGSRNTPLIIGFASNPAFQCYSIVDERSAGFFALGIAQQIKKPVVLVCTSGSALLNYYPAFAEAFYSQIPLLILSADRPKNKIDIGDGQTIRQEKVFVNHSLYNANLEAFASKENDFKINKALNVSIAKRGPVHINAPFEEPLYETVSIPSIKPTITSFLKQKNKPIKNINVLTEIWNTSSRKMILVGVNEPNVIDKKTIDFLAKDSSVTVITENTSNLHHPSFITNIDTIITPFTKEDFEKFTPEILITFGGMIVSKRIKAFLRKFKPKHHWHIDQLRAYNTFDALTYHIETTPQLFFNQLIPFTRSIKSDYFQQLDSVRQIRNTKHEIYLKHIPFCDFKFFQLMIPRLPKNCQLQVSNSSAIRYAQLISIDSSIEVYCNRGTSGIDGSTSTAIGAAVVNKKQTVFITGDISFFYDTNALWNNYIPKNFKIILINNQGGGIFRILPGYEENSIFSTFLETTHHHTAQYLAKMYGFEYNTANDENSLEIALTNLFSRNNTPAILEVFTPRKDNDVILSNYFKQLI